MFFWFHFVCTGNRPRFKVIFKPFWCILSRASSNQIWCVCVCVVVTFISCVFLSPFVCIGLILRSLSKRFWGIPYRADSNQIGWVCVCVVVMCMCCVYWSPFVCISSFLKPLFTRFGCIRGVGSKSTSSSFWYLYIKFHETEPFRLKNVFSIHSIKITSFAVAIFPETRKE